jgi:hypothetical protein
VTLRYTFQDRRAYGIWSSAHPSRSYLLGLETISVYQRSSTSHYCECDPGSKCRTYYRIEQQRYVLFNTRLWSISGSKSRHRRRRGRRCSCRSPDRRHCSPLPQASLQSQTCSTPTTPTRPIPVPHRRAHASFAILFSKRENFLESGSILCWFVATYDVATVRSGFPWRASFSRAVA